MTRFEAIDFIIRTAVTAGSAHLANAYLAATQVGQLLGRTISQMPIRAAYVPFASTAAISVISDGIEHFVVNKFFKHTGPTDGKDFINYKRPVTKILTEVLVRVLVGGGLFAAGAVVTGGTLLPAVATGVAVGALVFVANKVMDVFKFGIILLPGLFLVCAMIFDGKESELTSVTGFGEKLYKSINPSTLSFVDYVLPDKEEKNKKIL